MTEGTWFPKRGAEELTTRTARVCKSYFVGDSWPGGKSRQVPGRRLLATMEPAPRSKYLAHSSLEDDPQPHLELARSGTLDRLGRGDASETRRRDVGRRIAEVRVIKQVRS